MTQTSVESIYAHGCQLFLTGDTTGARVHYLAALQLNPTYFPALANLGVILSNENKLIAAEVLSRRILQIVPHDPSQWSNYGNILMRLERYDESWKALDKATTLGPDDVGAWYNLALLFHRQGQYDKAGEALDRAEALGHSTAQVREDRAHFLLAKGKDLSSAFELYEARWNSLIHLEPWDFHLPEWQGEDLNGKHILVHAEQGFGDTIMGGRFVRDLAEQGAYVTFAVPAGLVKLFYTQEWPRVNVVDMTKLDAEFAKTVDSHSPLCSVIRHLKVTKDSISPQPYLCPPEIVVPPVDLRMINIGICWASGIRNTTMDVRRRVSPLEDWLPLASNPRVQLWNLWKDGQAQADIDQVGANALVRNCVDQLHDFAETAAFVEKLDLVITVDTAMVHLAGAMGKSTWMVCQYTPCWRWWNRLAGSGAPWYESVGIVHQTVPGSWKEPLNELEEILAAWIDHKAQKVAA